MNFFYLQTVNHRQPPRQGNSIEQVPESVCMEASCSTADDIEGAAVRGTCPMTEKQCASDHVYCVNQSPRTLKHKLNHVCDVHASLHKRLKASQKQVSRLLKTVKNLESVVDSLKVQHLSGIGLELVQRNIEKA